MLKKKRIWIGIIVIIFAIVIIVISVGGDGSYERQIENGYKQLEKGNSEKAYETFTKILDKNEGLEEGDTIDIISFKAMIGLIKTDIQSEHEASAERLIRELLDTFYGDIYVIEYDIEDIKYITSWYIQNGNLDNSVEIEIENIIDAFPELADYFVWSELLYEEYEPYKEYRILYIDGVALETLFYTGQHAIVEWRVEGYEAEAPFKEYEIKYFNGVSTGEVRYTGKTKPIAKTYRYSSCPYCGYSAALSPSNHPGHGLEGIRRFERGQNEDGSWGFLVVFGETPDVP